MLKMIIKPAEGEQKEKQIRKTRMRVWKERVSKGLQIKRTKWIT